MKALKKNFPYWIAVLVAVVAVLIASQGGLSTPWYGGGWQGPESGGSGTGHCTNCDVALFADSSAVSHYADSADFADSSRVSNYANTAGSAIIVGLRDSIAVVLADSCPLCDGGLRDSIGVVLDDSVWAFFRDSVGAVIWDSVWESSTLRDSVAIILSDSCVYCDPDVFRDSVGAIIHDSTATISQVPSDLDLIYMDTTLTIGGSMVKYFDLRDKRNSADYDLYRAFEEEASWYAGTHIPTRLLIVYTAGSPTSTLSLINADDGVTFKTYRSAADSNYILSLGSTGIKNFRWLDHRLYVVGGGLVCMDFLTNNSWQWGTTGMIAWKGGLANGNDNTGYGTVKSGLPAGQNVNNDLEVWRTNFVYGSPSRPHPDFFATGAGATDAWAFFQSNSASARVGLKASSNSITDSAIVCEIDREHGSVWWTGWLTDHYRVYGRRSINSVPAAFTHNVDEQQPLFSSKLSAGLASAKATYLDWALTTKIKDIAILESRAATMERQPIVYAVSDSGLYSLHPDVKNQQENAGKIRWNSRYATPYVAGDWVVVLPMTVNSGDSGGEDAGAQDNTFAVSGSPSWTNPAGPYGAGLTFSGGTGNYLSDADNIVYDPAGPFSFGAWVRMDSVSAGIQVAFCKWDNTTTGSRLFRLSIDASEYPTVQVYNGANRTVTGADSLQVGRWYYIVGVYDGAAYLNAYINGRRMAAPAAVTGTLSASGGAAYVGGEANSASFYATTRWRGAVQGAFVSHKAMIDEEIAYEYERGKRGLDIGASAYELSEDTLAYASSDFYNFAVVGNGDTAYVLSGDMIIGRHSISASNKIVDAQVWQIPGTNTYSVALLSSDTLKIVQGDGSIESLVTNKAPYKEWSVPANTWQVNQDGTGQFWEVKDAADFLLNHALSTTYPSGYFPRRFDIGPGVYSVDITEMPDSSVWRGSGRLSVMTGDFSNSATNSNGNEFYISDMCFYGTFQLNGTMQKDAVAERIYVNNGASYAIDASGGIIRDAVVEGTGSCIDVGSNGVIVDGLDCKSGQVRISGDGSRVNNVLITNNRLVFDQGADSNIVENVTITGSTTNFLAFTGSSTLTIGNIVRNIKTVGVAGAMDVSIVGARNNSIYNFIGNDTTSAVTTCSLSANSENNLLSDWRIGGRISVAANCDSVKIFGVWADSLIGDTTQDATHQRAMNLWRKGPSPGTYSP